MLLAGPRDELDLREIRLPREPVQEKVQRIKPHSRIRVDLAISSPGNKAAG